MSKSNTIDLVDRLRKSVKRDRTPPSPRRRRIAPRLADGTKREKGGHAWPPHIKDAFRMIAQHQNRSMNWVLEELVIDYYGLKQPEYVTPKTPETPPAAHVAEKRRTK